MYNLNNLNIHHRYNRLGKGCVVVWVSCAAILVFSIFFLFACTYCQLTPCPHRKVLNMPVDGGGIWSSQTGTGKEKRAT